MISLDSSISPSTNNSYWLSNSGQFAFGFYKQGNGFAIGIWFDKIKEKTVIWTANRDQQQPLPQSTTLVLNDFANFVSPDQPAASASLLDSGNFVLYNSDSEIIWQSFENPTEYSFCQGKILRQEKIVSAVSESNHSLGTFQLRSIATGISNGIRVTIVEVWDVKESSSINYCTADNRDKVSLEEFYEVLWEKNYYSIVPKNSRIACEQDCLKDCQCEIAVYTSNTCNKLRLPLRYAKPDQRNINVVTMVKVLKQSSETTTTWVTKGRSERVRNRFLISSVVCIVFSFIFLLLSMFLCCRRNFHSHTIVYRESNRQILKVDEVLTVRSFTFNELELATNFFMEPLGKGSFGTVFKGTLRFPDGERAIAVKRLEKVAVEGEVEFLNEMRSIGRTHHKNLVRLLGYCHENSNRLLVYDYMSHGSLSNFLFKSETKPHWNDRVKIALGIARGILYLHEDCENKIIHCDINPNNILIDENCDAKIADFGLAQLLMPDQTRTHTGIRGTRGFVAPEWHKGQPITTKADVYSFGIVLLVIICCRPSVDVSVPEKEAI
ncbi:hypothetical protein G4B88_004978 [Cannabis sativa]|uniref:non-specific serine/threonine protein kinase n=1 Tax=Cannabis sativa TaxID=3483 RepID=A0A7J6FZK7_CANSA|nr:hypothetical protein G4B88_004978 [Cannabis sativa]